MLFDGGLFRVVDIPDGSGHIRPHPSMRHMPTGFTASSASTGISIASDRKRRRCDENIRRIRTGSRCREQIVTCSGSRWISNPAATTWTVIGTVRASQHHTDDDDDALGLQFNSYSIGDDGNDDDGDKRCCQVTSSSSPIIGTNFLPVNAISLFLIPRPITIVIIGNWDSLSLLLLPTTHEPRHFLSSRHFPQQQQLFCCKTHARPNMRRRFFSLFQFTSTRMGIFKRRRNNSSKTIHTVVIVSPLCQPVIYGLPDITRRRRGAGL